MAVSFADHAKCTTMDGRRWTVRHGHLPDRMNITGPGPVAARPAHVRAGGSDRAPGMLATTGATSGHRNEPESARSWRDLLLDLKRGGLAMAPQVAAADSAGAVEGTFATVQRRTFHPNSCLLNKAVLPIDPTLIDGAQKCRPDLDDRKQAPRLIEAVKVANVIEVIVQSDFDQLRPANVTSHQQDSAIAQADLSFASVYSRMN